MLRNLILIRHGEGRHQAESFVGGWSDAELTELGIKQAQHLAKRLSDIVSNDAVILSSDIKRSAQTAEIIMNRLQVPLVYEPLLREISQGVAEDMSREDALKIKAIKSHPILDWRPYPASETWREFDRRIIKFMETLKDRNEETGIIVSHSQTSVSIIHNWLGLTDEQKSKLDIRIDNCSLSILSTMEDGTNYIKTINDLSHYNNEGDLLSKEHELLKISRR